MTLLSMRRFYAPAVKALAPLLVAVLAEADGGPRGEPVQKGPEVSGSQSDTSPPLRDIKPAEKKPGKRVHQVKPLPRPRPPPPPPDGSQ